MYSYREIFVTAVAAVSLFVAACSSAAPSPTASGQAAQPAASAPTTAAQVATPVALPTTVPTTPPTAAPTSLPTTVPTTAPTAAPTTTPAGAPSTATPSAASAAVPATSTAASAQRSTSAATIYKIIADGTQAGYRVREQLADKQLPSDAVGTTSAVTGQIALDADGQVIPDQSKITVDMTSLKSDSGMRDSFIKFSTLNTRTYPTATFVPTEIKGLPSPPPTSGPQAFQLIGNLTIHGVTKPATWIVTAQVNGGDVTGQATTEFKFEDYGMTAPRAPAVLSVVDDVKLEVTLHLAKSA